LKIDVVVEEVVECLVLLPPRCYMPTIINSIRISIINVGMCKTLTLIGHRREQRRRRRCPPWGRRGRRPAMAGDGG
jgi:hypothetical protein